MNRDSALPAIRLETGAAIAQATTLNNQPVTPDSPALSVMTDLSQVRAATANPATTLRQAEQIMIYQGVRMLFVVSEMPAIEGLVTTTDLRGDKTMRVVNERGLHFDEVSVADVMTPLGQLDAVDFALLKTATVSNMVATLKRFGRNHLLVFDTPAPGAPQRVRGVISRSQIERQLGQTIELTPIASSFAEIERALY